MQILFEYVRHVQVAERKSRIRRTRDLFTVPWMVMDSVVRAVLAIPVNVASFNAGFDVLIMFRISYRNTI